MDKFVLQPWLFVTALTCAFVGGAMVAGIIAIAVTLWSTPAGQRRELLRRKLFLRNSSDEN
jgi:hypothetical protein